ncbi:MAG TPA: NAD(P)H-quinone oxidoreductase [Blastocatellia bacterium]|nr:NAD(P)H-quinone oxidoreductase [Blastocatellia bacterium]
MRAVYITDFGGPERLEIREMPEPSVAPGKIKVRVSHAGVNRADILQRRGLYPGPEGYDPHRPGLEFAGVVAECGEGVSRFNTGDRVFGITSGEAQAEFVVVDQRLAAIVPEGISLEIAAAVPEAYVTAHDALVTQAGLSEGESVFIHAAASGVGIAACQIAKARGAKVIATSRTAEKLDELIAYCDHPIIPESGPIFAEQVMELTEGQGVDVVLDLVGGAYFPENLKSLASKGRMILVGLTAGRKAEFDMGLTLAKRLTIKGTVLRSRSVEEKGEAMAAFASDVVRGLGREYTPIIDTVFPVESVREAHERVESNKNIGKVILSF